MDQVQATNPSPIYHLRGERVLAVSVNTESDDTRSLIAVLFNEGIGAQAANEVIQKWPQDLPATLEAQVIDGFAALHIVVDGESKLAVFNALSGLYRASALKSWEVPKTLLHYQIPFDLDWRPAQS